MITVPDRVKEIARPNAGWLALLAAVGLSTVGILAISTADLAEQPPSGFGNRQFYWLLISMAPMLVLMLPHPRQLGMVAAPLMAVALLLLVVVVMPFMPRSIVPVRNGVRAWIDMGFMNFQPSELAKLAFVLTAAWYLRHARGYRSFWGMLVPFGLMLVPVALILAEPDLGTAALFAPALFAMLVAAGAKLRHLSMLLAVALLAVALNIAAIFVLPDSMQLLRGYQRDRIEALIRQSFMGDDRFVQTTGYQQDRSQTMIGAGGVTGYGRDRAATLLRFNKLPEDHNDMVFAVIVNRWGLAGGVMTMGLYLLLLLAMLRVAAVSKDPFARLSTVGFAALMFSQMTINIGMAIGLLPIIGITLPFISYGGSSLIMSFAMIGLTINFASRKPAIIHRPSFEYDAPDPMIQHRQMMG